MLAFFYSSILNRSQNALHVTDDSHVEDVLQLTGVIVMASSDKKKNTWLQKFKNN